MLTPALDPLFIAYNTGAGGRILHTICIVRKYFTQQDGFKCPFGRFPVKNYSKEPFEGWLRVNFLQACCCHANLRAFYLTSLSMKKRSLN